MKLLKPIVLAAILFLAEFASAQNPTQIINEMEGALGGWNKLYRLHDVEYTYTYHSLTKNTKDVSLERYIFKGEQSWANYSEHKVNVFTELDGEITQSYVNGMSKSVMNGKEIQDLKGKPSTEFMRKTNFYWLFMMFKLNDPGVQNRYLGSEKVDGKDYHKIEITFDDKSKPQHDSYIIYVNKETKLVDQFYFSVVDLGHIMPDILMQVAYETIDGITLPTKRNIYFPAKDGSYDLSKPGTVQTVSNLKFNNGFTMENFKL